MHWFSDCCIGYYQQLGRPKLHRLSLTSNYQTRSERRDPFIHYRDAGKFLPSYMLHAIHNNFVVFYTSHADIQCYNVHCFFYTECFI